MSRLIDHITTKGPFKNHVDGKSGFLDPPSPHVDAFYISGRRQNQEFFDPPPPWLSTWFLNGSLLKRRPPVKWGSRGMKTLDLRLCA